MDKLFKAKDDALYVITIDDDGCEIVVSQGIKRLGEIRLDYREDEGVRGEFCFFHITHLELGRCKGLGIGRACLEFHKRQFDMPLTAGYADRGQAEDGSHLTGDGVGFIARMREEGIVEPEADQDRFAEFDY